MSAAALARDHDEFDDLSPAELAFRDLLSRPADYARWAASVRLAWELDNVVWCHGYRDGEPIWRRERPPQNPEGVRPRFGRTLDEARSDGQRTAVHEEQRKGKSNHERTDRKEARTPAHPKQPRAR